MRTPSRRHRARLTGLLLGYAADVTLGDPMRLHPVAGFGHLAARLESALWRDSRSAGVAFTVIAVGSAGLVGGAVNRGTSLNRSLLRVIATAAATWTVLGGTSLVREGERMSGLLQAGDLAQARVRLSHLCARDATDLDAAELARATVESLAENTSDAVVGPLAWGVIAGIPGLLVYRAVNTLDAMVGYHSERYERFGWASARLDDLANLLPARLAAALTVALAPAVGGSSEGALRVLRRDGRHHRSPNAGRCEAAFAGALGLRLGGVNRYGDVVEERATLGDGPAPTVADITRAARLSRLVGAATAGIAAGALIVLRPVTRPVAAQSAA